MNFDDAIKAHAAWKLKLSGYLSKPDGSIKATEVELDNRCDLGKWIYGDGKKHASLAEYSTLKSEHAVFHKAAAEVVRKADAGQNTSEEVALGGASPFSKASQAVVAAIMAIKSKAS